ncbi:MAG: biotin/lipoyl-binding protein [Proteobacteria bacterium]|nr:biotin/lipoyl-binding protein [Pseudomonadota bacterium]
MSKGKMTVFKTDRHEDMAAMVFVSLVTVAVLLYMAYIVPNITITPTQDGKLVALKVAPDQEIKKGDLLYTFEYKDKKFVDGKLEEKLATKDVKASTNGKVLSVDVKEGDTLKKGKTKMLVLDHEKGTLP